ncbi:MAG: hypothetical protein IKI94_11875 [Ruminococcus sp.]|nr:hypothetical protein [Ruminococcus sp.]
MKRLSKHFVLFLIGGTLYIIIEIIWRKIFGSQPTHWTMFLLGGLAFIFIGLINEYLSWKTPLWLQCLIGTLLVLLLEFVFGCVLNLWLNLNIWDYSNTPFNILGQVCLPFAFAWYFLTAVAIILDDYLRYWLFKEEKPKYYI